MALLNYQQQNLHLEWSSISHGRLPRTFLFGCLTMHCKIKTKKKGVSINTKNQYSFLQNKECAMEDVPLSLFMFRVSRRDRCPSYLQPLVLPPCTLLWKVKSVGCVNFQLCRLALLTCNKSEREHSADGQKVVLTPSTDISPYHFSTSRGPFPLSLLFYSYSPRDPSLFTSLRFHICSISLIHTHALHLPHLHHNKLHSQSNDPSQQAETVTLRQSARYPGTVRIDSASYGF